MTKGLTKSIGSIAFYVLTAGLFIYAASRSLDFIQSTLPPDQKVIGFLGLLATEGGAMIWLIVFLKEASGLPQKSVSVLTAIVDMLGSIGLFTMDTLYRSGQNGAIAALTPDDIRNVILALSGLIGLNLISAFVFHVFDPENMRKMREDSAHDAVTASLLKQIEDESEHLAQQMTPMLFSQWQDKFTQTFNHIDVLGLGKFKQHGAPIAIEPSKQIYPAMTNVPKITGDHSDDDTEGRPESGGSFRS
ncbi:MAG: hypothetical protein HYR70_13415 [Chloroflexi bacterium]|nr:hypothetical protein [Chloroflexota bacterium]MBI3339630.1 hypothetical protein [Chloroflexota bacterium]